MLDTTILVQDVILPTMSSQDIDGFEQLEVVTSWYATEDILPAGWSAAFEAFGLFYYGYS